MMNEMRTYPGVKLPTWSYCTSQISRGHRGKTSICPVWTGPRRRERLHYLALGILLFMFLWWVRLFSTQLLAKDANLELIAPFRCSQLHSSPSSSGSSSSLSSTSLSASLRSSRSTWGEKPKRNGRKHVRTVGSKAVAAAHVAWSSAGDNHKTWLLKKAV